MAVVKGDLQRLGPLEIKVDLMLEKVLVLERLEKMVQMWEDSERVIAFGLGAKEGEDHHSRRFEIRIGEGNIGRKRNGDEIRLCTREEGRS